MVQLEQVSKFIVKDVNLYVPPGSAVGVIGKSGAGKTTLLKLISGILQPETGRVCTMGQDPIRYRKCYGAAFSAYFTGIPLLDAKETVQQGYEAIASVYQLTPCVFAREYRALSRRLGFGAYENESVQSLSLGQRARAELGAALLYRPQLLLLDEPTVGLDQEAKQALRELLQERVEQGMTLLISSHDMNEVSHLCSRIALLHKGKLEFYGDQEQLHWQYHSLHMMQMRIVGPLPDLGDIPFLRSVLEKDRLTLVYASHYITSAEILQQILHQTSITELVIRKADLGQVILQPFGDN